VPLLRAGVISVSGLGSYIRTVDYGLDARSTELYWLSPSLEMRWSRPDGGDLLLRLKNVPLSAKKVGSAEWETPDLVYAPRPCRYIESEQDVVSATESEWRAAAGSAVLCTQSWPRPREVRLGGVSKQLWVAGELVTTAAEHVISADVSPDGLLLAILSASGPATIGGGYRGQHYHQVFSLPEGRIVGQAVGLQRQSLHLPRVGGRRYR